MKKVRNFVGMVFTLSVLCSSAWGQNTFPSSGTVGIGTTSPWAKLDVRISPGDADWLPVLELRRGDMSLGAVNFALFRNSDESVAGNIVGDSGVLGFSGGGNDVFLATHTNVAVPRGAYLYLSENGNGTGNIGIGTSSPMVALHVVNPIEFHQLRLENPLAGDAAWDFAIVSNGLAGPNLPPGSLSIGTVGAACPGCGGVGDGPHYSKLVLTPSGEMQASSEGFGQLRLRNTLPGGATWSFAIVDNGLSSSSLPTGSLSLGTIEGSGGIGDGPHHSKFVLTPNGEIQASVVVITSDARLKTNITPLTNTLEKLTKVRGVLYDWNDEAKTLGRSTGRREIGVLAQDVEAVFPELVVNWGKDNYKAVDYGKLTGVLIEAVKELRAEKDAQITTLEARLAALEQATGIDSASGHVASSVLPSGWLLVGGLLVGGLVCRSSGHAKHQR